MLNKSLNLKIKNKNLLLQKNRDDKIKILNEEIDRLKEI